jgi:hypothetical protein
MHDSPVRQAPDPPGLTALAQAEAGEGLALVLTARPGSMLYQLPGGRDDKPDAEGRHTKTVNTMHAAIEYARFPGCEHCRAMAQADARCHNRGFHGHYSGTWAADHPGTPNAHYADECPDGYQPPNWEPGLVVADERLPSRCHCDSCRDRRAVIGF